MRVVLDDLELRNAHGTVFRNPAHVVPSKVDQHHVLGQFLLVGQQVFGEGAILLGRLSARSGSRDGAVFDRAPFDLDQHLGRGSDDGRIVHLQIEHVRRRVHGPQGPIDLERMDSGSHFEALREDDLEYVSRQDVLAGLLDCGAVGLLANV